MTGFEYAAASLMIQEGLVQEGIEIVEAIRDRYDGKKRNPYAEIECGSSYARSMASFALPAVFSGFRFDMTRKIIGFAPVLTALPFVCFWSVDGAWGTVRIEKGQTILTILYGRLELNAFVLPHEQAVESVTADGRRVSFGTDGPQVNFAENISMEDTLIIRY